MGSWADKIAERVETYERRLTAAFKGAAQDVARGVTTPVAAGGNMRVKTGFLRASMQASTTEMPKMDPTARPPEGTKDNAFSFNRNSVSAVIIGASHNDTIYLGFTAAYAAYREVWDGFIEKERLKWPQTVESNSRKAIRAFP